MDYIMQITQKNFHDNVPVAKHCCFIPSHYGLPVIVFLWKYYLYIGLYSQFHCCHQKKKPFLPHLKRCIVHLDNVIEAFICPILSIPFDKIADYHSKSFDEYLIAETILGCHDPEAFKIFHSICPINIERMDAEDFTDDWAWHRGLLPAWHRGRLPRLMEGMGYNYDVDMVPDKDWGALWNQVQGWHKCKLDTEWISTCVPWEDDYGNIIYPLILSHSQHTSPMTVWMNLIHTAQIMAVMIKREELEGGARPIGFDSSLVAGMSYRSSKDQPPSSIQSREPCQGKDQIFEEETMYPSPTPSETTGDMVSDIETSNGNGGTNFHEEENLDEIDDSPKEPTKLTSGPTTDNVPSEPPNDVQLDLAPCSSDEGFQHMLLTDGPHDQINISLDPPTTKCSRGHLAGSNKKGKAKQTERGPEFVTTHVLQSKAHHPSLELQYDMVVVTISPHKKPMVMSGWSQQLCDVSPTILRPTAGPSHSSKSTIQTASTPSDEAIQNDVPSVLKNLPAVLHSLAKKSIGDEEDIVEQFVKVFSTLKDIGKTHQLQVSTMFSKIKANKHAYYLNCNLVEDAMRLGMYLKKKERELRNDGKDVDVSVKKGYMILACVGTAVYSVQTPMNIVSLHLAPVKYVQSSPDKPLYFCTV
ncbi:hypothetical protein EDC04DRAFT_2600371 [Pisolithus marmoratus]|nr:hypothetical protein EDC04DRAFT_2600371 [Pisolithus marmoratus]